ncbi:hypothetical protein HMPREF0573_11200 [Mobiluncus curtisii ATCC 43063]|uniref:Uncharacterized protein n=1 Tax=Mobiluncus curtisii (strain ATCC 43063 / DSM 2711 / V125) TaxID=548479 RepID=D6ZFW1_MOBCV|nr:hypothetical protein HMPREF0573_11200 [Mobiluncus curtisii ATCC 43063]
MQAGDGTHGKSLADADGTGGISRWWRRLTGVSWWSSFHE